MVLEWSMGEHIHIFGYYLFATDCYWQCAFQPAVGIVLGFIGTKMIFDFCGEQSESTLASCCIHWVLHFDLVCPLADCPDYADLWQVITYQQKLLLLLLPHVLVAE
jgi:hypothetical protein